MAMTVVDVRKMRVPMRHAHMLVGVRVRLASAPIELVRMLVVFVVRMAMLMLDRFMCMGVLVPLAHVKPDARAH
jgi:hypothetical protein